MGVGGGGGGSDWVEEVRIGWRRLGLGGGGECPSRLGWRWGVGRGGVDGGGRVEDRSSSAAEWRRSHMLDREIEQNREKKRRPGFIVT